MEIKDTRDALKQALILYITAPSEEQEEKAQNLVQDLIEIFAAEAVQQIQAEAEAELMEAMKWAEEEAIYQ